MHSHVFVRCGKRLVLEVNLTLYILNHFYKKQHLKSVHMNFDSSNVSLLKRCQHVQDGVEAAAPGKKEMTLRYLS